jgi:hypothetical protein
VAAPALGRGNHDGVDRTGDGADGPVIGERDRAGVDALLAERLGLPVVLNQDDERTRPLGQPLQERRPGGAGAEDQPVHTCRWVGPD